MFGILLLIKYVIKSKRRSPSSHRNSPTLPKTNAATEDSNTISRRLLAGAIGFLIAAEATHERHILEREIEHWPAIIVNLCFALELSLKAFIASRRSANRKELKDIGHNLVKALSEARTVGYSPTHPAVPKLINALSPLHNYHSLRYLEGHSAELPDTRDMISIVRKVILDEIGPQLQSPICPANI